MGYIKIIKTVKPLDDRAPGLGRRRWFNMKRDLTCDHCHSPTSSHCDPVTGHTDCHKCYLKHHSITATIGPGVVDFLASSLVPQWEAIRKTLETPEFAPVSSVEMVLEEPPLHLWEQASIKGMVLIIITFPGLTEINAENLTIELQSQVQGPILVIVRPGKA